MTENRSVVAWGRGTLRQQRGMTKAYKEPFEGYGYAHCLNHGDGFTGTHMCQNAKLLKFVQFLYVDDMSINLF